MAGRRQHGEGSLYQRSSDGRWIATVSTGWKDGKRQRRVFTATTPDAARKKREDWLASRRDGFTIPKGRQPYVSEWMLHWLHNIARRKVAETTWESSYRQKVTDLICPYFERVPLPELSEEDIEEWHRELEDTISERTGRPLSASTIRQAHRIFSTGIKAAVARGKLPRNPLSNVTPPAVEEIEIVPPSVDEVRKILARCKTWPNGARWVLAITTGLRQGEALGLEWPAVKLTKPASVSVKRSAARVRGKGRVVKDPKSRSSMRSVPLSAEAVVALTRLKDEQPVRGVSSDVLFRGKRGAPVHPKVDYNDWCALLNDLGLPHYRTHDCRHGYATMLLEQGVPERVVQELLGWSPAAAAQLLKRYAHVRETMHHQAAVAISRAVRGQ